MLQIVSVVENICQILTDVLFRSLKMSVCIRIGSVPQVSRVLTFLSSFLFAFVTISVIFSTQSPTVTAARLETTLKTTF